MQTLFLCLLKYIKNGSLMLTGIGALSWFILCHGIIWPKGKRLRYCFEFLAYFLLLWLAFVVSMSLFERFNTIIWIGLHAAVSVIYVFACSDLHKQAKILLWCSLYAGICCLSTMSGQITYLIIANSGNEAVVELVDLICFCLMILIALYLRHFNFDKFENIPHICNLLVIVGDISIIALTVVEYPWMKTDYRIVITLLASVFCLFVIVLVIVFAIFTMCKEQAKIIELQAERQRLLGEQELVKLMEANLDDLRCIRHDLKNQFAYLQLLLQGKRYDELEHHFSQMYENLLPPISSIDCGNQVIANILNIKMAKARRAMIPMEHQLIVPPQLPFADDDVCSILANLVDNAIDECERLRSTGVENAKLRIEIYPQKSYLFIMCSNTTDREKLNRKEHGLRTTKSDEQLHGYGTRIVVKIAEKYNGCAQYSLDDGQFVAKVMLDMMIGEMDDDNKNCAMR